MTIIKSLLNCFDVGSDDYCDYIQNVVMISIIGIRLFSFYDCDCNLSLLPSVNGYHCDYDGGGDRYDYAYASGYGYDDYDYVHAYDDHEHNYVRLLSYFPHDYVLDDHDYILDDLGHDHVIIRNGCDHGCIYLLSFHLTICYFYHLLVLFHDYDRGCICCHYENEHVNGRVYDGEYVPHANANTQYVLHVLCLNAKPS
jgi:hypothetical protein